MRILLVSDLHYTLPQLDWVVSVADDFDLVVLAGDTLSIRSAVPLAAQPVVITEYLSMLQSSTQVVLSSGNHDLTGPDHQGEQSALWLSEVRSLGIPTDGDSLELGDALVTVCPWWDGPLGRERVAAQLAADLGRRPARWLWVYHWPPIGSPTSWTGRREYGDRIFGPGSRPTSPTPCSPATYTRQRSSQTAHGRTASDARGSSMPGIRSAAFPLT